MNLWDRYRIVAIEKVRGVLRRLTTTQDVKQYPEPRGWNRFVSVEWMLLILWIAGFSIAAMQPLTDPDTPWHLATGQWIIQHLHVPRHDVFSWSMHGKPWVTQEWGFEVCLAVMKNLLGFTGIWLFVVVLLALTVVVLYRLCNRITKGNRVMSALLACLGTVPALPFWIARPQIISYFMFAIFFLILQRVRDGKFRTLWAVPGLLIIWANMHGSSIIGIIMLLLEVLLSFIPTIGRLEGVHLPKGARLRLLLAAVSGFGLGLLNPNGIKTYTYALLSTNPLMTNNIVEWNSPNFHNDYYKYAIIPFLILVFLLALARNKRIPLRETLYFGGCFAETLIHQRFLPYLALAAVPMLAPVVGDWVRSLLRPSHIMQIINGVLVVAVAGLFGWQSVQLRGPMSKHWSAGSYPIYAVQFLEAHHLTHKRILNAYGWGGYLIYMGIPTFIDGRTDIFIQNGVFANYLNLQNGGWNARELLTKYAFNVALVPSNYALTSILSSDTSWKLEYSDATAEVFVKTGK